MVAEGMSKDCQQSTAIPYRTRSIWKMLGPFATASRCMPIHQVSLSHAACASMSTTTTTTRDRGDRYGPIEWAQRMNEYVCVQKGLRTTSIWQTSMPTTWSLSSVLRTGSPVHLMSKSYHLQESRHVIECLGMDMPCSCYYITLHITLHRNYLKSPMVKNC